MTQTTQAVTLVRRYQDVDYYRVGDGPQTNMDAAHVVDVENARVLAVYMESELRADQGDRRWTDEDEIQFRAAVEAHVAEWPDHGGLVVQYDPGRDQCEEVVID